MVPGTDSGGGFGLRNASTVWRQVATADGPLMLGTDSGGQTDRTDRTDRTDQTWGLVSW
jgi:hypothetical protein